MQHDLAIVLPLRGGVPALGEPLVLLLGLEVLHGRLPLARRSRRFLSLRHSQHIVVEQDRAVSDQCGRHLGILVFCFLLYLLGFPRFPALFVLLASFSLFS